MSYFVLPSLLFTLLRELSLAIFKIGHIVVASNNITVLLITFHWCKT